MNINKYFVSILLLLIIKVNCGVYNHLDMQLALLILSAGDHNGNIIKDANGNYLEIIIGREKDSQGNFVDIKKDITEIIPALVDVKKQNKSNSVDVMKKEVEKYFKKLYIKSERLATYRMGYKYDEFIKDPTYFDYYISNLYDNYKNNGNQMNGEFEKYIGNMDVIKHFTKGNIEMINGKNKIDILSFYKRNNYDSNGDDVNIKNLNSFKDTINNGIPFKFMIGDNENFDNEYNIFKKIAEQCHSENTCKELFDYGSEKDPQYTILKDSNHYAYLIVKYEDNNSSKDGVYCFEFQEKKETDIKTGRNLGYRGNYIINTYTRSDDNFMSLNDFKNFVNSIDGHGRKFSNGLLNSDKYIEAYGYGLIADCKIIIKDKDGNKKYDYEYRVIGNDDRLNDVTFYSKFAKESELDVSDRNLLCSYYNDKYNHIEDITRVMLQERNKLNNDNRIYENEHLINIQNDFRAGKLLFDVEKNLNENIDFIMKQYFKYKNFNEKEKELINEFKSIFGNVQNDESFKKGNVNVFNKLFQKELRNVYSYNKFKSDYIEYNSEKIQNMSDKEKETEIRGEYDKYILKFKNNEYENKYNEIVNSEYNKIKKLNDFFDESNMINEIRELYIKQDNNFEKDYDNFVKDINNEAGLYKKYNELSNALKKLEKQNEDYEGKEEKIKETEKQMKNVRNNYSNNSKVRYERYVKNKYPTDKDHNNIYIRDLVIINKLLDSNNNEELKKMYHYLIFKYEKSSDFNKFINENYEKELNEFNMFKNNYKNEVDLYKTVLDLKRSKENLKEKINNIKNEEKEKELEELNKKLEELNTEYKNKLEELKKNGRKRFNIIKNNNNLNINEYFNEYQIELKEVINSQDNELEKIYLNRFLKYENINDSENRYTILKYKILTDNNNREKYKEYLENFFNFNFLRLDVKEYEYVIVNNLFIKNLIEKLYPVRLPFSIADINKQTNNPLSFEFNGILSSNAGGHAYEYTSTLNAQQNVNKIIPLSSNCQKNVKRSGESCKLYNQPRILEISFKNEVTLGILKQFKEMNLNSNILPYTSEINNINNIKMLVKDANSIDEVWNTLVDTYKNNIEKFDKKKSENFIRNFNIIVNDSILEYTDSRYNKDDDEGEIDGDKVNNLMLLRSEIIKIHEQKNGDIDDIEIYSINSIDSQSKYNKERYKKLIEKLSKITKIDPNIIFNSEDAKSAIDNLCEKINNLDEIENIDSIYNELNDLKSINKLEMYQNGEASLNSEIIQKLYNSVANRAGKEIDEEIISSENNLKVLINNKEDNLSNLISNENIDEITLKTLNTFKNKNIDKNILPYQDDINDTNDVSDPKLLYKNAENILGVWKGLSKTYNKNFDSFNEQESNDYIVGFNNVINKLKYMLSNSEYNNDINIRNINSNDIENIKKYFNRDYNLHKNKYNTINDKNGNVLIHELKYNKDLKSKYYRKNIIHCLGNLVSIVNINNGNVIYGLGIIFKDGRISSEIDYRTIGEGNNLNESINSLCKLIEKLDPDSLNDVYKNELYNIYDKLHDMILIVNEEYNNGIISDNGNIIYILHNSVATVLDKSTLLMNSDINNSENKIIDPDLESLEDKNAIDVIKDNDIPSDSKQLIFKGIESHIKNSNNKYLNKNTYNFVINTKKFIDQQGMKIKELRSYAGNELYILNIVSLSSNYNDLVATAICYDKILSSDINNNIPISTLEFDKELDNRVKYLMTNKMNSVISTTAKSNPKIYNIKSKFTKEDKFNWGDNIVYAISESSLINMFYDKSNINSKSDVLSHLIEDSDVESYDILSYSVELNYHYVNYQSPGSINSKDANAVTHNYNKLHNKLIRNIQPIDEFQNEMFSKAIDEVIKYNPNIETKMKENENIKIEEVFNEISEYDDKIKESITDDTKKHIETTINKFTIYVVGSYYKFTKMLGRENQVTIDNYKSYLNNNIKYVSNYITRNNINLNNKPLIISIKPNMNNINNIHNYCLGKNNIVKANKQFRIKYINVKKQPTK